MKRNKQTAEPRGFVGRLANGARSFAREAAVAVTPAPAPVDPGLAAAIGQALDARDARQRDQFKATLAAVIDPDRSVAGRLDPEPARDRDVGSIVSRYQPLDPIYARLNRNNERTKFFRSADLDHWNLEWFKAMVVRDHAAMLLARDRANEIYKARATILAGALDTSDPTAVLGTTGSGNLLPQPFADAIMTSRTALAVIESLATVYTMTSTALRLPSVGVATAYKTAEGVAPTQGEPATASLMLRAERNSVLMYLSKQSLRDSAANFMTVMSETAGRALALSEDTDFCTSNGTHPACSGALVGQNVDEASTTVLTVPDLYTLYRAVGKAYRGPGCAWLATGTVLSLMDSLADDAGRPILSNPTATPVAIGDSPGNEGFVLRHPVYEVPLPAEVLMFGNIRAGYAIGRRTGIEVSTNDGPGFDAGLIHVLIEEEYDGRMQDVVAVKQMAALATVA